MDKLKHTIEKIKTNKKVTVALDLTAMLLQSFVLMCMILYLAYTWEVLYQIIKDYYLGIAVLYFLISLALLQRVKIFNVVNIIFTAVFAYVAYKNVTPLIDMQDVYNAAVMKWTCSGVACVLLIDMIMYKKIARLKERNLVGSILYLVVALIAVVAGKAMHYSYLMIIPVMLLFLQRIDKNRFQRWLLCLSVGYYAAFLYTMIQSFISVPYTGERYYGIYINHGFFGIFIGGSFVCALWWFTILKRKNALKWQRLLTLIPMAFSLICIFINGARVSEFAVLVVSLVAICMFQEKIDKKSLLYRALVIVLFMGILTVVAVGLLYLLNGWDKESIEALIKNDILREKILYWQTRAKTMFNLESRYDIFEPGSIINAIDRFSSGRLSYWVTYLRATDFSPEASFYYESGEYAFSHPHNAYICWLYGLGIIPGVGLIIWIIYYLIQATIQFFKKNDMSVLSFLWVIYFMIAGINESVNWVVPVGFITLLLYYPLIAKYEEVQSSEEKEGQTHG